jgi:capsular polysaccharide biosynthesis protein
MLSKTNKHITSTLRIREGKSFRRNPPENLKSIDADFFDGINVYECPPLNIYFFKTINILPDSTLFKWLFPLDISFPFFKKRLKHHNWKGILAIRWNWKKIKFEKHGPYLIIHDQWSQNYYHWITQALPRLLLAQESKEPFTLLLPKDHQSEFHLSSLKLLHVQSWLTIDRGGLYYSVPNVQYPNHDIQVGDYNDDLILDLRKSLVSKEERSQRRKIFIHRVSRERRRILNEQEVLQLFVSFGFEIVEFERLSFQEQISLASNAKILAGVHGAGLTNMIFMPPNSTVFELTTVVKGANYYYFTLSNTMSHRYYYQLCETDQVTEVQEANLHVDLEELKKNLSALTKND